MVKVYIVITCVWLLPMCVHAQQKRALIIGIDQYTPAGGYAASEPYWIRGIPDLNGCKNDALAMQSLLLSRFAFAGPHIDSLFNSQATREAILSGMRHLLANSQSGDIAVIYYAGHGTRVKNSLSFEVDHYDQCIVPVDTWKDSVTVIRDKELSKIFNDFIDKHVKLTVIFDCCNSGSLSRGIDNLAHNHVRYAPEPGYDVKDPYRPEAYPEDRPGNNFLILSAAQSDEPAQELKDDQDIPHGAFTMALTEAFLQQSVDASVSTIFSTTRAIMKGKGLSQEPLANGSAVRRGQTLLGISEGTLTDRSLVAVEKISGTAVWLQGGFAVGLYKGNELAKLGKTTKDTLVTLVIDTVLGVTTSMAHIEEGDVTNLAPGNQLIVTNWASSGRPLLKLYIPPTGFSETYVAAMTRVARELKASSKTVWLADLSQADAYTRLFFSGGKCYIKEDTMAPKELVNITVDNILAHCKKDSTVFMELPLTTDSAMAFTKKIGANRSIKVVTDPAGASYVLYGRLGDHGHPAYGWRRSQLQAKDSLESMPLVTTCFEIERGEGESVGDSLLQRGMALAKLLGWLMLPISNSGQNKFAYRLEIIDDKTGEPIDSNHYRIGEMIHLRIVYDGGPSTIKTPRFLYVFGLDKTGLMYPFYPSDNAMNEDNKFPKYDEHGNMIMVKELAITGSYPVSLPSGTDNYFLLTSNEAIHNAATLMNQPSVYAGNATRGGDTNPNPLTDLLDMGNMGTRGMPTKLPATWSLQKIVVTCTY